jgi:hypothetical protein
MAAMTTVMAPRRRGITRLVLADIGSPRDDEFSGPRDDEFAV